MPEPEMGGQDSDKERYSVKYSGARERRCWRLQELSDDGKRAGHDDYFPWTWSLWFRAKEVGYYVHHGTETYDEERKTYNIETEETINAELVPTGLGKYDRPPRYTIMGFNRTVEQITLKIRRSGDNSSSTCYTAPQIDYGVYETEPFPDFIEFEVSLEAEKFDAIAQLIKSNSLRELTWMVSGVDGFYSYPWVAETKTDLIKILPQLSEFGKCEVGLELPDGLEHEVPRTGDVGEFSLHVSSNAKCDETEEDKIDDEDPVVTVQRVYYNAQMEALKDIAVRLRDIQISAAAIFICLVIGLVLLAILSVVLVC